MKRLAFVVAGGALAVSGYAALVGSGGDGPPIAERSDCGEANRPEPNVDSGVEFEVETEGGTETFTAVGSAEYPPPPESPGNGVIKSYVGDHEIAYRRNELVERYGRRLVAFEATIDATSVLDRSNERVLARVDLMIYAEFLDGDRGLQIGDGPVAAVYAIDETGAVRVEAQYHDPRSAGADGEGPPDPLEAGQLVACF